MRTVKLLAFLITFGFGSVAFAQTPTAEMATNTVRELANKKQDRLVVNFNFDNWFHKETSGFATKWYSRGIDVYFMYDMPIKKSKVSFAPGIGFSSTNIYHNANLEEDSTGSRFVTWDSKGYDFANDFKKAKLTVNYIDIPLELRVRSKPLAGDMRFKFAIGAKVGIKINAFQKIKTNHPDFSETGTMKKFVERGYDDISLLRFGPTMRLGYGPFNVHVYYNAINLFKTGRGNKIHPFTIGLSINGL